MELLGSPLKLFPNIPEARSIINQLSEEGGENFPRQTSLQCVEQIIDHFSCDIWENKYIENVLMFPIK